MAAEIERKIADVEKGGVQPSGGRLRAAGRQQQLPSRCPRATSRR
jgi:hypothetical protein